MPWECLGRKTYKRNLAVIHRPRPAIIAIFLASSLWVFFVAVAVGSLDVKTSLSCCLILGAGAGEA